MIKNYIKVAFRNFILHKAFTAINILGLALGFAACLIIVLYVNDELRYDRYNTKSDRIYRVAVDGLYGNTSINWTATCPPLAAASVKEFPEIEDAVRISDEGSPLINFNQKCFTEFTVFSSDSNIFNIFTFPVIQGNPQSALNSPNTLAICESTAKKIFGNENPINKTLKLLEHDFRITAIIKDIPKNSHINFDMLVSSSSFDIYKNNDWWDCIITTYYLLKENTNYKALEAKIPIMQNKYMAIEGGSFEKWLSKGNKWKFYLQPLNKIHLTTDENGVTVSNNNMTYVYIFTIVAFFILLLASVNFTNLSTAKASLRFKESGIRRVIGSKKKALIIQFLTESILISLFAALLGLIIVEISIHWFNQLTDKVLKIEYFANWYNIPLVMLFVIVTGFMAGIVPAYQMSSFKTLDLLKENKNKAMKAFGLREALIVFQFLISISLIISTLLVQNQLQFMQNKELGFDKDNVIIVQRASELQQNANIFKDKILSNPQIKNATYSNSVPGYSTFSTDACIAEGFNNNKATTINKYYSDIDFPTTLGMQLSKGRFFSNQFPSDSAGILINQSAAKLFNWQEPIGKKIVFSKSEIYSVIGVIKDYHYESLQKEIKPACIVMFNQNYKIPDIISVRINNKDIAQSLSFINKTWDEYSNGVPFQYSFLDKDYGKLYEKEKRTGSTLTVFSILAIFIACLGLFGLASFIANRRTKEIGIRMINGAHSSEIFALLSIDFIKWIAVAYLIACPIAWYAMNKWLQNFAYKTELSWWIFALAGVLAMGIALLTVSWQSWKAATRNPVEALRYE